MMSSRQRSSNKMCTARRQRAQHRPTRTPQRQRGRNAASRLILLCLLVQLVAASTIDFTSDYATLSSRPGGVVSRHNKLLHPAAHYQMQQRQQQQQKQQQQQQQHQQPPPALVVAVESREDEVEEDEEDESQQQLIALSAKSYISGPTTVITTPTTTTTTSTTTPLPETPSTAAAPSLTTMPPAKLTKRAGHLAATKQKPLDKSGGNRTRVTESRAKLHHNEAGDHIPDSSGHIPYRIGRPVLASGEYEATGVAGPATNYHTLPYDTEKWHSEYWEPDYQKTADYNNTRVQHIEAECQDDFMKIRVGFNGSFSGLVYSAGYAYDPDCMYINGSGRDYYEFYIQLNRCGTLGKNALHEEKRKNPTNFMWNTVTVQYNPLIEEEFDEHFKVTCEYGYDFWKTVTFPFLDVEVATGNPVVFTLSPPECYMEIQNGYGIGGPRVTGPVRVGDPLTLIIYMRSKYDGFDIVVNDCYAHNGANKRIQLIDDYGCPVDDKLISRFRGSWSDSGVFETQVYAYMKTFRFTGSPALYIECDVRMCHGRCPSQPCHWRNLKAVTKRDLSNTTTDSLARPPLASTPPDAFTDKPANTQSDNINLFQSLRVLQEGEADGDDAYVRSLQQDRRGQQTCLRTGVFSALGFGISLVMCLLSAALMITCSRLKQRRKTIIYDGYINHKGRIA